MTVNFDDNLFQILPNPSIVKLTRLLDQRDAAHEAVVAAHQRFQDAHEDFKWIGRSRSASRVTPPVTFELTSSTMPSTGEQIDPADRELVAAKARVDRAAAARNAAGSAWEKFGFMTRVTDWLHVRASHGGNLSFRALPEVRLAHGETHQQAVVRIRDQIAAVDKEWQRVETAPLPLSDLKVQIVEQVDKIAAPGQPRFLGREAPDVDETVRRRTVSPRDPLNLREVLYHFAPDGHVVAHPTPFIFWMHRDAIVSRLESEAEKLDFSDAMDDDQRESAFSRLLDQRLALAWQEESIVEAAAEAGTTIVRRPDADPRSILQIVEFSSGEVESQRPARRRAPAHMDAAE